MTSPHSAYIAAGTFCTLVAYEVHFFAALSLTRNLGSFVNSARCALPSAVAKRATTLFHLTAAWRHVIFMVALDRGQGRLGTQGTHLLRWSTVC